MDKEYDPRLALIEAETRYRLLTQDEPKKLEATLSEAQDCIVQLKHKIDNDIKSVNSRKREMMSHMREAKFYQDKINQLDERKGDQAIGEKLRNQLLARREDLNRLRKCLEEFDGMEPTNADLQRRIDELQASQLNLEMTFVGDPL